MHCILLSGTHDKSHPFLDSPAIDLFVITEEITCSSSRTYGCEILGRQKSEATYELKWSPPLPFLKRNLLTCNCWNFPSKTLLRTIEGTPGHLLHRTSATTRSLSSSAGRLMLKTARRRRIRDFDVETWYKAMPAAETNVVSSGLLSSIYRLRLIAQAVMAKRRLLGRSDLQYSKS